MGRMESSRERERKNEKFHSNMNASILVFLFWVLSVMIGISFLINTYDVFYFGFSQGENSEN